MIACVAIATTVRAGITIFTYCDDITFGIAGDYTSNPDLQILADGIENAMAELLTAAKRRPA